MTAPRIAVFAALLAASLTLAGAGLLGPALTAEAGGSLGSTVEDPHRLESAVRRWNFTGYNGSIDRTFTDQNISWIHVRFPVTPTMAGRDVHLRVQWWWPNNSVSPDWSFYHEGYADRRVPANACAWHTSLHGSGYRGKVWAEAAGRDVGTHVADPFKPLIEEGSTSQGLVANGFLLNYTLVSKRCGIKRPTFDRVLVLAGNQASRVRIQATWNETFFNLTYGGNDAVFDHTWRETNATAEAGALWTQATVNAEFRRRLRSPDRPAFFVFNPGNYPPTSETVGEAAPGTAWYERPDGSRVAFNPFQKWYQPEWARLNGSYRFHVTGSANPLGNLIPPVMGARIEEARMPWRVDG